MAIVTKNLNKSQQITALMPNLIHSLDASTLALLVNFIFNDNNFLQGSKGEFLFYSNLDCIAVTANKVVQLILHPGCKYKYLL